jgi:CBS domain-containing protein
MQTMAQLLKAKGGRIWAISPDATVFDGLRIMAERDIGALVVTERGRPIGVVSERDYARKVILRRRSSHDTPVRMIMTTAFATAPPHMAVDACMALMTNLRTRHVLVMEGDELRGIVSIGDLVKSTINEQQFTIAQLERYIAS